MAERRMFAKSVVDSDKFIDMPKDAQLLYYTLAMHADDDGFVTNSKRRAKMLGVGCELLDVLKDNGYIIIFESGAIVIRHWKVNNFIRKDTYRQTICREEKRHLKIVEAGIYEYSEQPVKQSDESVSEPLQTRYVPVDVASTQDSIGKDSLGEASVGEVSRGEESSGESSVGEVSKGEDSTVQPSSAKCSSEQLSSGKVSAEKCSSGELSADEASAEKCSSAQFSSVEAIAEKNMSDKQNAVKSSKTEGTMSHPTQRTQSSSVEGVDVNIPDDISPLVPEQYKRLLIKYPARVIDDYIGRLRMYCQSNGKTYRDYEVTIRRWIDEDVAKGRTSLTQSSSIDLDKWERFAYDFDPSMLLPENGQNT